ncbi:amino acid adenylation domain-containing protein/non-ribosomal peptide synthase protein (TIGR01720 family) [Azomonas macrocytogenes]|uniref:Amino acid adenylation domain-containing protein/non-ribosomal peptide synthase protein (TIGR01720 family) n=1 Tax=Azomonas macrocytogenes TaxID=69962 RepID=A0A839TBA1_AZOMA|nr:amino acid adenylation domain-containing protein/non-ribosomal peptide synthase protein (TIGR01720 family) [Azomonas macrocytogenes]
MSLLQQEYVAPQSELEQQLAGIWAQVLKVERVGLTDNFFELGGDSIISIQVVSRARQLGIRFSARDLFLHQTVQMLARVAERSESPLIDQGLVMGMVPLTPVQLWFFEQPFEARDHWNQSLLLTPRHRLEASVLARTLAVLVRHHDALRLRFAVKNGVWSQTHAPITAEDYLWQGRTDDSEALNAFCERVQRSLSLQAGPMLRGALIEQADGSQRLLLVIHHLVVDGVSWRILLEDLQSVYKQLENAMPVELPSKSSSYQHWAQYLKKHVQMPVMQDELAWWQERLTGSPAELPRDNPAGSMQNHHSETVIIRLDAERTRQLLKDASAVYRTQVNDLLLTALARVFCRWSKTESILIQLEGHGREDLFDELDLTRTLGWFTSMFPVRLSPWADADADIAGSIKQIKEELRAIPSKGMSYGLLRYLGSTEAQATLAALPQPRITFNYLGQFDNQFDANTLFVPAQESSGCAQSEQDSLANWLSIEGEVYGGRLSLQWGYSREVYRRDTIERLAGEYQQELEALIAHCLSEEAGGATPSDFPLVSLTQEQLDALPIATTVVEDIYPLTPMQEGLLLHTLLEPHSGIYFMQDRYIIDSDIDLTRFTDAWRKVICRHDALRTSFNVDDQGRTLQIIHRKTELELEYWDWSEQLESEQEAALQTLLAEERRQGFDLLHKPPFRLYLIKRSPSRYWFILCNHHALLDAWCRSLLLEDFFAFYRGEYNLVPAPRYRDFIAWLQERGETAALSFWCEELRDVEQPTPLPFDRNARRHDGASVINDLMVRLPREQGKRLRELAQQQQLTVNTLAQAAWSLVLHRYSGNRDLLFGVTVAGRPASCPQMQYTVGLFINTIPLRVRLPDFGNRCSVRQWLQSLLEQNFVLREHEHLSLVKIHECSGLRKGQQLFDSLFVFESAPVERSVVSGAGQISAREDSARTHTNYPLTVVVYPDDELGLHLSYDQRFFDEATVERLLNDFKRLLEALVDGFEGDFASLPLLSVDEQHWLLEDCNRTGAEYPLGSGYVRLFEAQVAQGSSRVVARCLDRQWTYRDLNVHANRLGHALRAAGVSEDQPVALLAERGLELLGMIIGSFKAGAGYLPLDPHLPVQRLIDLLMLSHTPVLVCSVACVEQARSLLTNLPAIRLLVWDEVQQGNWLDTNLGIYVTGQHLGYVIYTSGSTGTPKGVMVEQAGMLNNQLSKVPYFGLIEKDVIAQTASQSFDISVWQFLAAPLFGGCVEIVPNAIAHDPVALLTHVQQSGISVLESVPSLIQGMLAEEKQELPSLRWMLPTGEAMPPELARQWLNRYPEVGLVNAYGPAECSDDVALHSVTQVCTGGSYLPIGTPTDNNRLYLLDDNLNPVPVGAIGELYVAGIGVGRGYLSDPKRSAEAFLPHLFGSEGARLYRTGDLVKRQVSGVLEYVGRVDHQVKIRGFRIELGEIEALLHEHPELADAAVAVQETSNGRQLVGYAVPISTKDNALPERLKQALKAKLPDYMVPLHWCLLEKLPRNVNGKLDRKALPALEIGQTQGEYVAPRNGLESTLAEIWRKVLKVERVGITDNFFELGGHSLLVVQVVTRIRNQFNIDLKAKDFFELPDLAALSQYIQREGAQANLVQDELTKSLEALKRLSAEEINELIS